jgi:hypothetical protein
LVEREELEPSTPAFSGFGVLTNRSRFVVEGPAPASTRSGVGRPLAGGFEQHRQAYGGEPIQQPREPFGVMQLSCLELDQATEKQDQQTAEGVHPDLLVGPVILWAHRHVLVVLELPERLLDFALATIGDEDLLV